MQAKFAMQEAKEKHLKSIWKILSLDAVFSHVLQQVLEAYIHVLKCLSGVLWLKMNNPQFSIQACYEARE